MILKALETNRRMKRARREAAAALYRSAVTQARRPAFYRNLHVPDTLDGRFELIAVHVILVLRRLGPLGKEGEQLAQALFDTMFADMDFNLREMGVGDLSVGKRVKAMAQAFYGRAKAYEVALDSGTDTLVDALARNVYGTVGAERKTVEALADYVSAADRNLAKMAPSEFFDGAVTYPDPPNAADR